MGRREAPVPRSGIEPTAPSSPFGRTRDLRKIKGFGWSSPIFGVAEVTSTNVPNLVRDVATNIYHARIRANNGLRWKSLRTTAFKGTKDKLRDVPDATSGGARRDGTLQVGVTFRDACRIYEAEVKISPELSAGTQQFRLRFHRTLGRTWLRLWKRELRRVKPKNGEVWRHNFLNAGAAFTPNRAATERAGNSPTIVNGAVWFLREGFRIGGDAGLMYANPAASLKLLRSLKKLLQLPNRTQFGDLVKEIRQSHSRRGQSLGDLVEGLAYTGVRAGESSRMTRAHR